MNTFRIILTLEVQADLKRLDSIQQTRIMDKLEWMGENTQLLRHQPLRGEGWVGCFKYRVGDYRIIYQIDWQGRKLIALKVGHRRDVYT